MPAVSANFTLSESDGSATAFLVKGRRGKLDRNRFAFRGSGVIKFNDYPHVVRLYVLDLKSVL